MLARTIATAVLAALLVTATSLPAAAVTAGDTATATETDAAAESSVTVTVAVTDEATVLTVEQDGDAAAGAAVTVSTVGGDGEAEIDGTYEADAAGEVRLPAPDADATVEIEVETGDVQASGVVVLQTSPTVPYQTTVELSTDADATADAGASPDPDDESTPDDADERDGAQDDAAGDRDDETTDDGEGDQSGGLPAPDRRTGGLAIGSLAIGAGLLARKSGTIALASGGPNGSLLGLALDWLRAWGWRLLGLVGYGRYDDTDPLEHETRAAIYEYLEDSPGAYLSEVAEATDVPLSTVRYHLRILAFENLVTDASVRGKRRFFPIDVEPDALAAALEDESTATVLEAVAAEPDSVSGLAERLDRDPSTVTHHLQRLEDEGLVERERDGRRVVSRLADGLDPDAVAVGGGTAEPAD